MTIKSGANPGALIISGGVHTNAVSPMRDALLEQLAGSSSVLALDLTGVDMVDTAALQVLWACQRSAGRLGKTWGVDASRQVRETIAALGFPLSVLGEGNAHGG